MNITYTIVNKVAGLEGTDPLELPPLYDTIDSDALENLIDSANDAATEVRFTYFGYTINVDGDREVRVRKNNRVTSKSRQTD